MAKHLKILNLMLTKCILSYFCAVDTMRGEADKMRGAADTMHGAANVMNVRCGVTPPYGKK